MHAAETIRSLIDERADSHADRKFLISPHCGRGLTFQEFQQCVKTLCAHLGKLGVERGDKVAFLLDNGLFTVQLFYAGMYGGTVLVPLNVRAGAAQLSYMLDHCDAQIIFVGRKYEELISQVTKTISRVIKIIFADSDDGPQWDQNSNLPSSWTSCAIAEADPALLMYSSGTTGKPNAAIHTHKSLLAHGRNTAFSHQLTSADRSLLVLPLYHINAECVTLMPSLIAGASVVVPHGFAVNEFWDWLEHFSCTWSAVVPTIISQLLDWQDPKAELRGAAFQRIRFLRTSSAPLSPALHREFMKKFPLLLIQAMGSSEAGNVFSNPLPPGENKIGSPGLVWGFDAKIIKRDGSEVPPGEPGEVLIRGSGMMQAYYKDPASTAIALDSDRWLHTGDLAYQDEDGYFFVVGRSKELIIKGGMNIAPKQIDEVLESHPAVLEAAAVGIPDRHLGEDINAFVILRDGARCDTGELLTFCESRLGHFKTPTRIFFVAELPKGPSGKVQRLHLVEEGQRLAGQSSISMAKQLGTVGPDGPLNETNDTAGLQQVLAEIWSEVLGQTLVRPNDNFFALGGQSLMAIQCLSRLRERFRLVVSLSEFFTHPTILEQAALIQERLSTFSAAGEMIGGVLPEPEAIPHRDPTLPCPLSYSQQRVWFLEKLNPANPVYNEAEAIKLTGHLGFKEFQRALDLIVGRHEILRTTIQSNEGQAVAIVHANWSIKIKKVELSGMMVADREAELARLLVDEPRRIYDLESEIGLRVTIIKLSSREYVLILMVHHIVCDRLSLGILWRELSAAYTSFLSGREARLGPLPIQYGDYAAWQRQASQRGRFAEDLLFWKQYLWKIPSLLELPTDRARPAINSFRGDERHFEFGSALTANLRILCQREQISIFAALSAALNALLFRYTNQNDILLGIPIADRERPELQSLIGFLIDTHVLRTCISGEMTFRELMSQVQRDLIEIYSHRAVPFDLVIQTLQIDRNLRYSPLFQVMLNWRDHGSQLQSVGFPGLDVKPLHAQAKISKFDITIFVTDANQVLELEIEYNTDLFDQERIDRMFGHMSMLLEGAIRNPDIEISRLPLLTLKERRLLLVE